MDNNKEYLQRTSKECKEIRKKYNIPVKDIASKAGVTIDAVFKFERGVIGSMKLYVTYKDIERRIKHEERKKHKGHIGYELGRGKQTE